MSDMVDSRMVSGKKTKNLVACIAKSQKKSSGLFLLPDGVDLDNSGAGFAGIELVLPAALAAPPAAQYALPEL